LPRLELCAAVLGAELAERIKKDLRIRIDVVQYWTDSTIVLAWINATASSFHTFVANRIARIHELSNPEQWVHVASEDNPADLASRRCSATQLKHKELWFNGPPFLTTNQETWKQQTKHMLNTKDPEQRTITNHVLSLIKIDDWTTEISHHGSYDTLVGIRAWMLRFGNNCRPGNQKETGPITPEQRARALQRIIQRIQGQIMHAQVFRVMIVFKR